MLSLSVLLLATQFQAGEQRPAPLPYQHVVDSYFPGLQWEEPGVLSPDPVAPGAWAEVEPRFLTADVPVTGFYFEIHTGDRAIALNEQIRLVVGDPDAFFWDHTRYSVVSRPPLLGLEANSGQTAIGGRTLKISTLGTIPPHTEIRVEVEARLTGGIRVPQSSNPQLFWVVIEKATANGRSFDQVPILGGVVLPREPYRIQATLPTIAKRGDPIEARVVVLDDRDNPAPGFLEPATLIGNDGRVWEIPGGGLADGFASIPLTAPQSERFFDLRAEAPGLDPGASNVQILLTEEQMRGHRLVWADLQVHTRRSDGAGPVRYLAYRHAVHGVVDALGMADHDRLFTAPPQGDFWDDYLELLSEPVPYREMILIPGWEWTRRFENPDMGPGPKGHRCVFFSDLGSVLPVLRSDLQPWDSMGEILPELATRAGRVVAIPHHLRHYRWWDHDGADPALTEQMSPVAEVLSRKGNYEEDDGNLWRRPALLGGVNNLFGGHPNHSWLDGLKNGLRTGAVGGSDTHWGYAGLWVRPAEGRHRVRELPADWSVWCDCTNGEERWIHRRGALTGLFVREPGADGALEAMQARRCYASSGPQTGLWYTVNGEWMGSEVDAVAGPVTVQGYAAASTKILAIEVRRVAPGWSDVHTVYVGRGRDRRHLPFEWTDPAPPVEPWLAYYVRVRVAGYTIDDDIHLEEERAVGSPVWLDYEE